MEMNFFSLMHGMVYGLLIFLLAGILTLSLNLIGVFNFVRARIYLLAWVAVIIAGLVLSNSSAMAIGLANIVLAVTVLAGLGSLSGAFITSILTGVLQTYSTASSGPFVDVVSTYGWEIEPTNPYFNILSLTLPQASIALPLVLIVMILIFRSQDFLRK